MDAIVICYPQYWLQIDVEENFIRHFMLIKSHLELVKNLEENIPLEAIKICPSILYVSVMDLQSNVFKMIMKSNVVIAMEASFHVNPLTWLGCILEACCILWHSFVEFFKLVEITTMQVLGSVEDENLFHPFFHKIKIEKHFNKHLHIIVGMYSQTFYTLNTFPYDTCFDDWK
jgi:hypothetical protein